VTDASDKPSAPGASTGHPGSAPHTPPVERVVTTDHELVIDGQLLEYTAHCGTVVLREAEVKDGTRQADKPRASVFFIAYTLKHARREGERPITFSFNGGPGSSSVWLHLGILGPQRVEADEFGRPPGPPYGLVDNAHTLLTQSDLVFIDPVGTGYSRMAEGDTAAEFHEFQRDLDAVGEFIRQHLTRHGRWGSPKYLIGESYGTTRAAGLALHLQDKHDIYLNGLMLVSLAVDMQTLSFDHGNELPYPLYLPTYAATAWYHRALAPELQAQPLADVVAAAEAYALGDYTVALMQGSRLGAAERERVAAQVARFSGLSVDYVLKCDLRPDDTRYFKQLLRERGQTVGRLDARFTGHDRDDAGSEAERDAAMNGIVGAYAAGMHRVLRETLKFDTDTPYLVHAPLWKQWAWKDYANRYANIGSHLRRAMQAHPALRVYVASGYYDLATPHAAGDYTLSHLGLREHQHGQVSVSYFEAGHMMYIHQPSLVRMAAELRAFVSA